MDKPKRTKIEVEKSFNSLLCQTLLNPFAATAKMTPNVWGSKIITEIVKGRPIWSESKKWEIEFEKKRINDVSRSAITVFVTTAVKIMGPIASKLFLDSPIEIFLTRTWSIPNMDKTINMVIIWLIKLTSPSPEAPRTLPKKILVTSLAEIPTAWITAVFEDFMKISFTYWSKENQIKIGV